MRSLSVVLLLLLLVGCGPAVGEWRESRVNLGQPDFSLPLEPVVVIPVPPVVVSPPAPVSPPASRPVQPVTPPGEVSEPTLPVEPVQPVTPPSQPDSGCRVKTLPPTAAVETITKCPRTPADLTFR